MAQDGINEGTPLPVVGSEVDFIPEEGYYFKQGLFNFL